MSSLNDAIDLIIVIVVALAPALFYLGWIRKSERFAMEPWGALLWAFIYGAIYATLTAALVEGFLVAAGTSFTQAFPAPEFTFLNGSSTAGAFFLVLVLAPFVEEALKAYGVVQSRAQIRQVADGPVFGASVGFGFGFFETALYGFGAYAVGGLSAAIGLVLLRSVSSVLLHGSSTGMFGYGYALQLITKKKGAAGRYYLVAVGMHSSFNALASLGAITAVLGFGTSGQQYADVLGIAVAVLFAFIAIEHVRRVILTSSATPPPAAQTQFRAPAARVRPGAKGGSG